MKARLRFVGLSFVSKGRWRQLRILDMGSDLVAVTWPAWPYRISLTQLERTTTAPCSSYRRSFLSPVSLVPYHQSGMMIPSVFPSKCAKLGSHLFPQAVQKRLYKRPSVRQVQIIAPRDARVDC